MQCEGTKELSVSSLSDSWEGFIMKKGACRSFPPEAFTECPQGPRLRSKDACQWSRALSSRSQPSVEGLMHREMSVMNALYMGATAGDMTQPEGSRETARRHSSRAAGRFHGGECVRQKGQPGQRHRGEREHAGHRTLGWREARI